MKQIKTKRKILFLLILLLVLNFAKTEGDWCWTVSMANDPNWVFNKEAGNVNWAYCKSDEDKERIVNYEISLKASTLPESITASSISVQVFGSLGALDTKMISLGSSVKKKEKFKDKDIGILNKLTIFISQGTYRCEEIVVSKGPTKFTFRCSSKLGPCVATTGFNDACMTDLIPDGDTEYEVTLKTADPAESGTTSPVLVAVVGKKGASDFLMFSDKGLKNSSKVTKKFFLSDVGDLTGFNLKLEEPSTWKPEYIMVGQPLSKQMRQWSLTIANFGPGNLIYRFDTNSNGNIVSSDNASFILNDGNFNPKLKDMYKQIVSGLSKLVAGNVVGSLVDEAPATGNIDLNNPDGGMMEPEELENIIELECDQEMINPSPDKIIFGDNYPTPNINYMNIIAKCPANCHKFSATVIGMGIHPENTPICLAALVDNAISEYGGIISLSIYPGLKYYARATNVQVNTKRNVSISNAISKVKKSFVLAKVDNPDLVEKDIRILDHNGKLAYEGRLEIRVNGIWRTVCNRRLDLSAARMICRELGYNDGKWEDDNGCNSFNGEDVCGSVNYNAIFSDLTCLDIHKKFSECNKKIANESECGRENDAVILCTNVNYDLNKKIDNGTVKLENVENSFSGMTGRLEYYMKEWGTVCGLGATDKTAELACKKMGFKYGNLQDERRFRRSKSDSTKINAILECQTTHTTLGDCRVRTKDLNCDHTQDLVIKCWGGEGDYSGRSQYPKEPAVGPPQLGKLGMQSVKAECITFGNNIAFRGDPGSIFYVTCPADCNKISGTVWGTGLYTADSNICLAAIHSGVIKPSGGPFVLIKTWGQPQYRGSLANGVVTNNLNRAYPISISFAVLNSGWKSMMNYARLGNGSIYLEKSSIISLSESSHLYNKMQQKNPYLFTSFLQTKSKFTLPEPAWEWLEPDPKHKFSNTGAIQISEKPLNPMDTYTIIVQFNMSEFKGKTFLFSCNENPGFNIFINEEDNLILGSLSGNDSIDTQLKIPQNRMVVLSVVYENEKFTIAIIGSDVKPTVIKKKRNIQTCSKIGLGRHATNDQDYFFGIMNFIQFFNQAIDLQTVPILVDAALKKPKSPVKLNKNSTVDNRLCISSCTDAPIPGTPGAPKMPPEADPYPPDINSLTVEEKGKANCNSSAADTMDISAISGNEKIDIDQIMKLQQQSEIIALQNDIVNVNIQNVVNQVNTSITQQNDINVSSPELTGPSPITGGGKSGSVTTTLNINVKITNISCEITLRDRRFDGGIGQKFRVRCDEDCSKRKDINVFGSYIYAPDSSVCKAAYHSGTLEKDSVGYIVVELVDGKKIYNQSIGSDGSLSITSGPETKSFLTRQATPPIKVSCTQDATSSQFSSATVGKKFLVLCPPGCSKVKNTVVYGEEIYADMSPICPSAIHWGLITDQGGELEFMIEGSQTTYKGTKGFGINSVARGQYIRSFRLIGVRSTIFAQYKEDFQGKFLDKYIVFPDPTSYKVPTEGWAFEKFNSVVIHNDKTLMVISNKTKIISNSNYGTVIILKNIEFVNGRFRSSWMFSQNLTHAMIFRYQDTFNYYAVEFNLENRIGSNVRLVKRVEGSLKTVAQARRKIYTSKWYKLSILMNFDHISVYLQSDNLRMNELIFESQMGDIYRGTVGFGANGSTDFYISGIEIDNHFAKDRIKFSNRNRRTWNKILQQTSEKERKTYCNNEFMQNDPNLQYCLMPRVYCKIRCDDHIPPIENIANYNCYKDCLKVVKEEDGKNKEVEETAANKSKQDDKELPGPKKGVKLDFLPPFGKSNQDYTPGTIKDVKEIGGKWFVDIEYENGFNNLQTDSNLEYPGDGKRIKKCKSVLTRRTDCDPKDKSKELS